MRGTAVDAVRFRQLRLARGLTQRELATAAGVGERTVRHAEAGRRVRLDFLRFLAAALAVDLLDIVHDRDELRLVLREDRRVQHILAAIEAHAKEQDYREILQLWDRNGRVNVPGPTEIPLMGEYYGLDGLREFFDRSAASVVYEQIPEIREIRTGGNLVVISGIDRLQAKPTGKTFSSPWTHIYEFDRGHVTRIDMFCDLTVFQNAFQASETNS